MEWWFPIEHHCSCNFQQLTNNNMPQQLSQYPVGNFSVLIVGEPKTGKTRVASAFPKPYYLDFDRNLRSILTISPEMSKDIMYDSPYLDVKTGEKLESKDVWKNSLKLLEAAAVTPAIETIIIDSLSSLINPLCNHIYELVRKQEGKKITSLRLQDYGAIKAHLEGLLMLLLDTGKTIVVLSHQKTSQDATTGVITYTLNIPGQLKDNFGALFNDIWATEAKRTNSKVSYSLRTKPTNRHVSLGTSVDLPDTIDTTDKTPQEIWAQLKGPLGL